MAASEKELGILALRNGDPRGAVTLLAKVAQQTPNDPAVHGYLGAAYGQLKMMDQAVHHLSQGVRLAPQSAPLRFNLGLAQEAAGQMAAALESYRHTVNLEPAHDRARAAIARLAPAEAASPAGNPVSGFVLPGAAPTPPASPAPTPTSSVYGAPPSIYGAAPSIYDQPAAPRQSAAASEPTVIGQPMPQPNVAGAPLAGLPPVPGASYEPHPPSVGAPMGMQPLGDWTPPEGSPAPGSEPWRPAPPQPSNVSRPDSQVAVISSPEREMPRSYQLGHGYLAGMGSGVWWGLLGAVLVFLNSTLNPASQMAQLMPVILSLCAICIAGGAIIYGLIGMWGAASDDPETLCGNAGAALGVLTALYIFPALGGMVVMYTVGAPIIGAVWIARLFGKGLGKRIAEMTASMTVVTGAGGVAVTHVRR